LFGDTINVASRMESSSEIGRVHLSKAAAELIQEQTDELVLESRGRINIKGKGKMHTYWLLGEDGDEPIIATSGSVRSKVNFEQELVVEVVPPLHVADVDEIANAEGSDHEAARSAVDITIEEADGSVAPSESGNDGHEEYYGMCGMD
jgi:hypothetical protein